MKTTAATLSRRGVLALAAVAALALGACGGSDDPAAAAEDFGNAIVEGDGEAACAVLSAELEQQAADSADGSCADAFTEIGEEDRARGEQAEYETVDESEDTATVEVTVPDEDPEEVEMIKEDGDWKVSSI